MPPTEDPAALVAEARAAHEVCGGEVDCHEPVCVECVEAWPCLPERLARALEAARKNNERLELQLFNCIGGPHTGHEYTNGMTGEVTYCCPAHQDGYTWLKDAQAKPRDLERAVVEAAIGWLKDGLVPPLEDAIDALLAAREPRP